MSTDDVEIRLKLRRGDGPLAGTIQVGDQPPQALETWLELLAALEEARNPPAPPGKAQAGARCDPSAHD